MRRRSWSAALVRRWSARGNRGVGPFRGPVADRGRGVGAARLPDQPRLRRDVRADRGRAVARPRRDAAGAGERAARPPPVAARTRRRQRRRLRAGGAADRRGRRLVHPRAPLRRRLPAGAVHGGLGQCRHGDAVRRPRHSSGLRCGGRAPRPPCGFAGNFRMEPPAPDRLAVDPPAASHRPCLRHGAVARRSRRHRAVRQRRGEDAALPAARTDGQLQDGRRRRTGAHRRSALPRLMAAADRLAKGQDR